MTGPTTVDGEFEAHRSYLEAVAYRMLGTVTEAQDAMQECCCGCAGRTGQRSATWRRG